jgi:Putative Ig domain
MPLKRTSNRSAKSRKQLSRLSSGIASTVLMVFICVSMFGLAACAFTVPVKNPGSLQLTTASLPPGHASQPYFVTLAITGGTAPYSWSVSSGSLPAGVSLSNNGALTGTPSNIGSFSMTIKVSDSSATMQTASKAYSLTVMSAVTPVSITTTSVPSGQVGSAYSAALAASGGTSPYSWSISSGALPGGLLLGQTNGTISGTPTASGQFNFTTTVTDSTTPTQQTGTQSFSLTIAAVAQPPTVTTTSLLGGTVNSAYSATVSASGGTTPYTWSITAGALPAGLTLATSSGVISGTPTAAGNSSFTVQVNDSKNNTATQPLSISIVAATQPPTVTTTSLSGGTVNSAYSATVSASGGTTPYSWTIAAGALPAGLTLAASSGVISGTPTAAGNSSFTVQVKDAKNNTATQALNISIAAAAQPPTVTTTSLPGGTVNNTYSATVSASGGTTPYTWSITAGALPAGLTLTASSGAISGSPTTSGNSSFTVQVKDAKNNTATQALNISIAAAAQPPTVTTTSLSGGTVNSAYSATVSASGGATPYSWTIAAGALPAGLTLATSSGVISGTPTAAGNSSFTVQVKDANNNAGTKALSITISAAIQPLTISTLSLASGETNTTYFAFLTATGGTTPYTWSTSSGSLPTGLTLSSAGDITGVPTASGTSSFTVKVVDSSSPVQTATQGLSIAIATGSSHSVSLTWVASPSSGVTGYNVYRSTTSGSGYEMINMFTVAALSYSDATVLNGVTYFYVTTAIDADGDESTYSNEVQMAIP